MTIEIRPYRESDATSVGKLIATTYRAYNLSFLPQDEQAAYLGPFYFADSTDEARQKDIARVLQAQMILVAETEQGEMAGILRGRKDRLQSLFVRGDRHRQGIGRRLVEHFEQACLELGGDVIKLSATLYAVPFYQKLGYKKSTGVRAGWSFDGQNFKWQPMKKILSK